MSDYNDALLSATLAVNLCIKPHGLEATAYSLLDQKEKDYQGFVDKIQLLRIYLKEFPTGEYFSEISKLLNHVDSSKFQQSFVELNAYANVLTEQEIEENLHDDSEENLERMRKIIRSRMH